MSVDEMNDYLFEHYELFIEQDENGWHEHMSLDYFDTPQEAFEYAVEYGKTITAY
jgi:hypothetical protein